MITRNEAKYIQSLGQKKLRDAEQVFVAEGPKLVNELLQADNCKVIQVYALDEWSNATKTNAEIVRITSDELQKISQLTTANQVLAVAKKIEWNGEPTIRGNVSLVLDDIQDPGNMGTIIRLADWFGLKNLFCSTGCVDIYNSKVVQASMGSITRVRVEYTNLVPFFNIHKEIRVYATVLNGRDVSKMEKINEGFIVIGNESKGIHEEIIKLSNVQITIPGIGKAESLNAAVSAGIILSHLVC